MVAPHKCTRTHQSSFIYAQYNNDSNYSRDSLSVVMRGYLIESLIREGITEVVFVGGARRPSIAIRPTNEHVQIAINSHGYMQLARAKSRLTSSCLTASRVRP